MSSGKAARRPKACGFPTRACSHIAEGDRMAGGPKVAILGAGSVGCFIGGAWAAAGLPVTFIGRPRLSKDVDQYGLTLSDYAGWEARLAPGDVDYRCGPEALGEAQVIALTVKSGDTTSAAAEIVEHG